MLASEAVEESRLGLWDLFKIFFRAGMSFGGGLAILSVLEDELIGKRKLLSREEFLAAYGIGRIVPSGTMTAVAVGLSNRFAGIPGTVVALVALVLPAFIITVSLTAAYQAIKGSVLFGAVEATVIPAALALIVVAAVRLSRGAFAGPREAVLAAAAFAGLLFLGINPAILLILGGLLNALLMRVLTRRSAPR